MTEQTFRSLAYSMARQAMGYPADPEQMDSEQTMMLSSDPALQEESMMEFLDWLDRQLGDRARERGHGW